MVFYVMFHITVFSVQNSPNVCIINDNNACANNQSKVPTLLTLTIKASYAGVVEASFTLFYETSVNKFNYNTNIHITHKHTS